MNDRANALAQRLEQGAEAMIASQADVINEARHIRHEKPPRT